MIAHRADAACRIPRRSTERSVPVDSMLKARRLPRCSNPLRYFEATVPVDLDRIVCNAAQSTCEAAIRLSGRGDIWGDFADPVPAIVVNDGPMASPVVWMPLAQ